MSQLESVFEVRSGDNAPGEGCCEGGMFSTFELAKKRADEVIGNISKSLNESFKWTSESRAESRFYWVEISEYDIIYPEQE